MSAGGDERVRLLDSLLDLLVYAPIGLTLDAQDLAPELARRGRQHTAAARHLGEFAVKAGMRKLEGVVAQMTATDHPASPAQRPADGTTSATAPAAAMEADTLGAEGDVDPLDATLESMVEDLPVPDYDLLAASQVVKRLDGLTPAELEMVRRYEERTRGRRTILAKIARLEHT